MNPERSVARSRSRSAEGLNDLSTLATAILSEESRAPISLRSRGSNSYGILVAATLAERLQIVANAVATLGLA